LPLGVDGIRHDAGHDRPDEADPHHDDNFPALSTLLIHKALKAPEFLCIVAG
jgi:hypothetical protein